MFSTFSTFNSVCQKTNLIAKISQSYIIRTILSYDKQIQCQRYDSHGNLYFTGVGYINVYMNNVITSVAGNGNQGYSGDNGLATSALIGTPRGICFDRLGNIYFTDVTYHTIRKIDISSGFITTIAGTPGSKGNSGSGGQATLALFNAPGDLTFDLNGNLYMTCLVGNVINKIATNGIITTIAGTGSSGYTGDGGNSLLATMNSPAQLYINDYTNCLYFVDGLNFVIRKIDLNLSVIITVVGTGTSGYTGDGGQATLCTLQNPRGVVFDIYGNMYIADLSTVRKVDINNIITTFAGTGNSGNSGDDGNALLATFSYAYYLSFNAGNLIFSDINNKNIRIITQN